MDEAIEDFQEFDGYEQQKWLERERHRDSRED